MPQAPLLCGWLPLVPDGLLLEAQPLTIDGFDSLEECQGLNADTLRMDIGPAPFSIGELKSSVTAEQWPRGSCDSLSSPQQLLGGYVRHADFDPNQPSRLHGYSRPPNPRFQGLTGGTSPRSASTSLLQGVHSDHSCSEVSWDRGANSCANSLSCCRTASRSPSPAERSRRRTHMLSELGLVPPICPAEEVRVRVRVGVQVLCRRGKIVTTSHHLLPVGAQVRQS